MFLYLFVIYQLIYSVSCFVTCHVCPIETNSFDYLITTNHIPDNLNDCTTRRTGDNCYIDIVWNRHPDKTQIAMSTRDNERSAYNDHTLYTAVSLEHKNSDYIWTRSISYTCSTDNCNSVAVLKRLLNALRMYDFLHDLKYLLRKDKPFDGNWCLFKSNATSLDCALSIPIENCKGCSFLGMNNQNSVEICANCLQDDIGDTSLLHEVDFNITDRTRLDHWIVECQFNKCNNYDTVDLVRQKSISKFDFSQFLDRPNKTNLLSSPNKIIFAFIILFIKMLD